MRVNDDSASNPRDQFFPTITVDDQGVVRAMWGDDRLDTVNPGGHNYDIFAAASTDHGASFGTNVRVTTQSSDPDIDNGGTFIGDYFAIAPCGTAVWGDTRNGNQDIFAAGLDQNGDGLVDDCVTGPPANTESPTINGTATTGATLSGSRGAWKGFPLPAFTLQWRRCDTQGGGCVDIAGATSDGYTLVASDAGHTIRLRVSGTNSLGSAAADSTQTAVVPGLVTAPPKCVVPMLIGTKLVPAKARITKQHCRVGKISRVKSTNKHKGRVIRQRPVPGAHLHDGARVDLWIGK